MRWISGEEKNKPALRQMKRRLSIKYMRIMYLPIMTKKRILEIEMNVFILFDRKTTKIEIILTLI